MRRKEIISISTLCYKPDDVIYSPGYVVFEIQEALETMNEGEIASGIGEILTYVEEFRK